MELVRRTFWRNYSLRSYQNSEEVNSCVLCQKIFTNILASDNRDELEFLAKRFSVLKTVRVIILEHSTSLFMKLCRSLLRDPCSEFDAVENSYYFFHLVEEIFSREPRDVLLSEEGNNLSYRTSYLKMPTKNG